MKHRQIAHIISIIVVFLATFTIALFQTNQAKAVSVSISGADASSAVITDLNGKTVDHSTSLPDWQTVSLSYKWSIPNDVQIANGDTTTFTLPSNVKANTDLNIPITDSAGNSVGTFSITKDAQVGTLTFSKEYTTDTENRQGTLQFYVCGTKADSSDQNFSVNKYGWISSYNSQDVPTQLTWNIALNSAGQKLTNVTLTDTLGADQAFVPNSVVANTGYYSNGQFISTGTITPNVSISGNTMKISFAKIDSAINLIYLAQVTPDANSQNVSWNNDVSMTCDQGNGVSTSSSHKIEWGGVGSGSGQVGTGNVVLTNTNSQTSVPIANSVFDLYDDNGKIVKSNLTTDQKGQISLTGLPTGNYYFLQTKTPTNYTLNTQKFPFTISDTKTATVFVTNTDPPATTDPSTPDPAPVGPPATTDPSNPDPAPVDPPATTDPITPDPTPVDPPLITDPTDPNAPTDPIDSQPVIPVDPSSPSAGGSSSANTPKMENAIFVGDPIVLGDPPTTQAKPVYYATTDNDSYRSQVFPSKKMTRLPQTGNDKNDSFLQSIVGVIILFIIGSEYLFWKKSKG